jgi:hypothetical protein
MRVLKGAGGSGVPLSDLLAGARADGASRAVLEVVALLVLQGFAAEDRETAEVVSEGIDGRRLDDPQFYGDDLLVVSQEGDR